MLVRITTKSMVLVEMVSNVTFIAPIRLAKGMETALYIVIIVLTALNLGLIVISSRNMSKTLDLLFTSLDSRLQHHILTAIQELKSGGIGDLVDHNPIRDAIGQVIMRMMDDKAPPGSTEILERDNLGQFKKIEE